MEDDNYNIEEIDKNYYFLSEEVIKEYLPIIENFIQTIMKNKIDMRLELTNTKLRPYTLITLLEEHLDYEPLQLNDRMICSLDSINTIFSYHFTKKNYPEIILIPDHQIYTLTLIGIFEGDD